MKSLQQTPMKWTVFNTPVVSTLLQGLAWALLKLSGWRTQGTVPTAKKFVMIAAPHTSNWDFPVTLIIAFVVRAQIFWMGKMAMFRPPFGTLFRWLGGIPIDRSRSNNVVDQTIELFRSRESFGLVMAPEGTRGLVTHWKTGFYHIARGAGVPIILGFLDYRRKVGGIGPTITPTGDIEADLGLIREFYDGITGKHADQSSHTAAVIRS